MARRNNCFVGLGGLLGRLARGQLPEPLQPLPLELEKLAGVVFVDRLQGCTRLARDQHLRLQPRRVILIGSTGLARSR